MIIERKKKIIIDVQQGKGSVHDFKLYKNTIGKNIDESILVQTDLGYLGIEQLHPNCLIPIKESKNHKLNKQDGLYPNRYTKLSNFT